MSHCRLNGDAICGRHADQVWADSILYVIAKGGTPKAAAGKGASEGLALLAVLSGAPSEKVTVKIAAGHMLKVLSSNRWQRWRQEEDAPLPLTWWVGKDDILRHSYGTYRAALDLFDRRFPVFEAAKKLVWIAVTKRGRSRRCTARVHGVATKGVQFLFNQELQDHCNALAAEALNALAEALNARRSAM